MRVDRVVTTAKTRLVIAAEGRGDVALAKAVDRDGTCPDRPRATNGIGGEDRGAQAVFGVIGDLDGLDKAFIGLATDHHSLGLIQITANLVIMAFAYKRAHAGFGV